MHPIGSRLCFKVVTTLTALARPILNFFNSLFDPPLVERADAMIQKTVTELNAFDNVYYEICQECYLSDTRANDWQNHLIETLVKIEANLPAKHMIAWN